MLDRMKTEALFEIAKKEGIGEMEIYLEDSRSFNVRIGKGKVEHFSIEEGRGFSIRGDFEDSMGYAYTENVGGFDPVSLIAELKENAQIMESPEKENIHFDNCECRKLKLVNAELGEVPEKEKISFALALESKALAADDRIEAVDYCLYGESSGGREIINSKGLNLLEEKNMAFAYVSVVARKGDVSKSGSAYRVSNNFDDYDAEIMADEAVEKAIGQLEATTVDSGPRKTILSNEVSASLLQAFSPVFSAENVQRNLSLLKGRLGESIAVEGLSVIDNPFLDNKAGSRQFDDEGTCTIEKKVIDKGVLSTFLHNKKTGRKDGVPSTGNAYKASYKSPVSIAPTNFFIETGKTPFSDALKSMGSGVYITDVQGLHSGLDTISGDFSLSARGFTVEKGRIAGAIHQMTIAGNFFEMITDIEAICDDLSFIMPGRGHVGSPSLLIGKIDISGE